LLPQCLLRVTMGHRAAELERQLWYPNPTDFPPVAERPESALTCRYSGDPSNGGDCPYPTFAPVAGKSESSHSSER
jgi:hypothetical protein